MQIFFLTYFFILGLVFGSFFNVVGIRVPKKERFRSDRSYCPQCNTKLTWTELVPVFSYLFQRGKCRSCHQSISPIYPLIEFVTGLLFAYSYLHYGFQWELIVALLFVSLLMIIIVTDLTYMLIPDRILLFFLPLFIISRLFIPIDPWWSPIAGALIGYVLIAFIILLSRGGMGGGDMKLLAVLGLVLGYKGVLLTFFLATIYGTIISILLLALRLIDRKKPIPFGPFIALGALSTYFFGNSLLNWYFTFFI